MCKNFYIIQREIFGTMASMCGSCSNAILNAEHISCAGVCGDLFHIKCVGVHKSMLNAVNSCPNIHWYCHGCNNANLNISSAIDRMNDAIGLLSKSLSGDLLQLVDSFKTLMETFMESITKAIISDIPNLLTGSSNVSYPELNERSCNNHIESDKQSNESHAKVPSCSVSFGSHVREPKKSVVISNIGKDVTVECVRDYLVDKLKVDKDSVNLALLLPAGMNIEHLNFVQYKITIPEANYVTIMNPKLWPPNVYIRDFVYKRKKDGGVTMQHFLV